MDSTDRIWPECLDVPSHIIRRLRAAADDLLERACDTGGEWDDKIARRVLNAAGLVLAFDIVSLRPEQVATLAHRGVLREIEDLLEDPMEIDDEDAVAARLGTCRELIALRNAALARVNEIEAREAP